MTHRLAFRLAGMQVVRVYGPPTAGSCRLGGPVGAESVAGHAEQNGPQGPWSRLGLEGKARGAGDRGPEGLCCQEGEAEHKQLRRYRCS